MRTLHIILAIAIAPALVAQSSAQCNRSSQSGPSSGSQSSSLTTNPLISGANLATAQQYRSRLAQQRYMLAMQQRYQQQRQQQSGNSLQRRNAPARFANQQSTSQIAKRERLRLQNAEKAMQLARVAEDNGNVMAAQKRYRQVLRILGTESNLGQQATDALAALRTPDQERPENTETLLASLSL